ncbi:MAG: PQQ-binding-like beta-propeller repeat protein [Pseudonocardia sp.]|nr:PQQ-binding-like beta-propeller repeat protein [Pseudonocardia sp.]
MLLMLCSCDGGGSDWTSRLGDVAHTSRSSDATITRANVASLKQRWRKQAPACPGGGKSGGGWLATPVTLHGVIYVGSNFGCLFALNESNGSIRWSKFTAFQPRKTCDQRLGIVSSVVVRDEGGKTVLYFHNPDGYLYKLDASDGSTIWRSLVKVPRTDVNDVYAWSSPTVANGQVVIGVSSNCDTPFVQGQVRSYDLKTGAVKWVHKMVPDGFVGAGDWYDVAVDGNGDLYVSTASTTDKQAVAHPNTEPGFEQYCILKLDGRDGHLIWKAPAPTHTGDPDYASSPILFTGGGVPLVGAGNKDGWFRAYRRDDGALVWQAQIGTPNADGLRSILSGGVWDGTHLFLASNITHTGGTWTQSPARTWKPVGGVESPGSVRALDPATGALATIGGAPFELPMPANILGPCTINPNHLLVCTGGKFVGTDYSAHYNGIYFIDTTKRAAILHHLEDTRNFPTFAQPVLEHGALLTANTDALSKWSPAG